MEGQSVIELINPAKKGKLSLILNYKHSYMRCDASIDTEQPLYRSYILVLISTYQVSSVWLECKTLQRKEEVENWVCNLACIECSKGGCARAFPP